MSTPQVRSAPMEGRGGGGATTGGNVVRHTYNRGGVIAVACVALLLFIAAWSVDGYFTARTAVGIGAWAGWTWVTWGLGWSLHVIVSIIQQHGWKVAGHVRTVPMLSDVYQHIRIAMWSLAVLIGSLNTLTTAVGLMGVFHVETFTGQIVCVILAEATAMLSEPMIVGLAIFLYYQIRRR
jgi:hypothetical protein